MDHTWDDVLKAETAHEKAAIFQKRLVDKYEEIFPEKILKIMDFTEIKENGQKKEKNISQGKKK